MEFSGERYVPGIEGLEEIYAEHMSRYVFASRMARSKSVLDVGCGCGYGTHHMALAGSATTLGTDISAEAIEFAKANHQVPGLHFAVMDAYHLALGPSFELVTCFEVIEHVEDPERALEQISGAMADRGILLISTPNKENYVAGGEAGSNPFHHREYCEDEFRDLLRSHFRSVTIYGQHWSESMILKPRTAEKVPSNPEALPMPIEKGCRERELAVGDPVYFLAVCAQKPLTKRNSAGLSPAVVHSFNARYPKIKDMATRLKADVDRRAGWARELEAEVRKRDATIRWLQEKLEKLSQEFDERGKWAQGLDKTISEKEHIIRTLRLENEKLKRMAGVRV
jgi:SAM-dependent methyltransferase